MVLAGHRDTGTAVEVADSFIIIRDSLAGGWGIHLCRGVLGIEEDTLDPGDAFRCIRGTGAAIRLLITHRAAFPGLGRHVRLALYGLGRGLAWRRLHRRTTFILVEQLPQALTFIAAGLCWFIVAHL